MSNNLDWVNNKTYSYTLSYSSAGVATITLSDNGTQLLSKTFNVAGKPMRSCNAIKFQVKASSGIGANNLITAAIASINGSALNTSLQTDGTGNASQQAAYVVGSSLANGFTVTGTIKMNFVGTYPPQGSRLNFFITAGNIACAQSTTNATQQIGYIQPDHLGSPRTVTNASTQTIWKWDQLDPCGITPPNQDADNDGKPYTLNLRFPGQYYDQETALHYNYFRDYDPNSGRYVQSDPIGLKGGINTYAYVEGEPMGSSDSQGLRSSSGLGGGLDWILKHIGIPQSAPDKFIDKYAIKGAAQVVGAKAAKDIATRRCRGGGGAYQNDTFAEADCFETVPPATAAADRGDYLDAVATCKKIVQDLVKDCSESCKLYPEMCPPKQACK